MLTWQCSLPRKGNPDKGLKAQSLARQIIVADIASDDIALVKFLLVGYLSTSGRNTEKAKKAVMVLRGILDKLDESGGLGKEGALFPWSLSG